MSKKELIAKAIREQEERIVAPGVSWETIRDALNRITFLKAYRKQ